MTTPFSKLKDFNSIIAFEVADESIEKFEKYKPSKLCYLDLSKFEELKDSFINHYEVKKLPCMVSFGKVIYLDDDLENNLLELDLRETILYKETVANLLKENKVFFFIKGSFDEPKCKFTRRLVNCFSKLDFDWKNEFAHFNILEDEKMREKVKLFSGWETYPQIYINGVLLGGVDLFEEAVESGKIKEMLK